jgi:Uma2 family endonuclease
MENLAAIDPPVTQLIEGRTYLMSPRPRVNHNLVVTNISRIFTSYLKGKTCIAFSDGVDVYLDNKNRYIPDVMIVCDRSKIHDDGIHGAPDLVVEVLSPSTAKHDRGAKMKHYAAAGVREYWIVTPLEKIVEVYWNHEGRFELEASYAVFADWELAQMTDEERAAVPTEIPVSLYDDLLVPVEDIFLNVGVYG